MTVERARRERDKLTGQNTDLGVTVAEAVDDYRRIVTDNYKSGYQSEVYLRHLVALHGHRRIATLSRAELVSITKQYAKERGSRSADRYLSQLRGVFNLAVEQGLIDTSPLLGVSSRITGYKPKPRSRTLTPDEINELWIWGHPNAALLRFLLLTGLRISEAQKGHREDDRWIVPAHYSKNGKAHWVYLTEGAKAQLHTPFEVSPTAVQAWVRRKLPGSDKWTPHDLRRTAATLMNDNGVQPFIVERVLGHTLTGLMAVYNHAEYTDERIEAAAILERSIHGMVKPSANAA
jgi:integrase